MKRLNIPSYKFKDVRLQNKADKRKECVEKYCNKNISEMQHSKFDDIYYNMEYDVLTLMKSIIPKKDLSEREKQILKNGKQILKNGKKIIPKELEKEYKKTLNRKRYCIKTKCKKHFIF